MKNAGWLLIALGLVLGPAYFYAIDKVSGDAGPVRSLTERNARWTLPDGAILRLKSGLAWKPLELDLRPQDNGHRFRLTFDMLARESIPSGVHNSYIVSLMQGDTTVFERSFELAGSGAVTQTLDAFDVLYPGGYVLLVEEVGTPPLGVAAVKVEVLTHVEKPRMWLAWSGLALMAIGIGLVLRDRIGARSAR
jgi:hypothetical protein